MHTLMVIIGGLLLLALCLYAGRALNPSSGLSRGALVFIPLWLVATGANMWVGVTQAGYTVTEEMPIFGLLFGSLAVVALVTWWKTRPERGSESSDPPG